MYQFRFRFNLAVCRGGKKEVKRLQIVMNSCELCMMSFFLPYKYGHIYKGEKYRDGPAAPS